MAFNKKHYKQCKKFMLGVLSKRPWCCDVDSPVEWSKAFLPMILDCNSREDYEGSKAIKDAIMEFLNGFLDKDNQIKDTDTLKLP